MVGIDFSGNPLGGNFNDFIKLFYLARENNLFTTIHTAELSELSESVNDSYDDETSSILNFRPDRVGHALYLQPHHLKQLEDSVKENKPISVEICPSSNFYTLGLSSHSERPFLKYFWDNNYPFSINTDDRGVFNTSMTEELVHTMNALQLEISDVVYLQSLVIHQTFTTVAEKVALKDRFWDVVDQLVITNAEVILLTREEAEAAAANNINKIKNKKAVQDQTDLLTMFTSF